MSEDGVEKVQGAVIINRTEYHEWSEDVSLVKKLYLNDFREIFTQIRTQNLYNFFKDS